MISIIESQEIRIKIFTTFDQHYFLKKTTFMAAKDSNGNTLNDGDSVTVIKDLKVKGTSSTLKRGTMLKGIKLTNNEEEVECRVNKVQLVLKTCFLKKA